MPVEHVKLVRSHGGDSPENILDRIEIPGRIEQEPAVGEDRRVRNVDPDRDGRGSPRHHLGESLEASHCPPRRRCHQSGGGAANLRWRNKEGVRLVNAMDERFREDADVEGERSEGWGTWRGLRGGGEERLVALGED